MYCYREVRVFIYFVFILKVVRILSKIIIYISSEKFKTKFTVILTVYFLKPVNNLTFLSYMGCEVVGVRN